MTLTFDLFLLLFSSLEHSLPNNPNLSSYAIPTPQKPRIITVSIKRDPNPHISKQTTRNAKKQNRTEQRQNIQLQPNKSPTSSSSTGAVSSLRERPLMLLFLFLHQPITQKTSNLAQIEALVFRFCSFMMLQGTENVTPVFFFIFCRSPRGEREPSNFVTECCPPLSKEVTTTTRRKRVRLGLRG